MDLSSVEQTIADMLYTRFRSAPEAFNALSITRNGHLTAEEMTVSLHKFGLSLREDALAAVARNYSSKGTPTMSFDDFCRFYEANNTLYTTQSSFEFAARNVPVHTERSWRGRPVLEDDLGNHFVESPRNANASPLNLLGMEKSVRWADSSPARTQVMSNVETPPQDVNLQAAQWSGGLHAEPSLRSLARTSPVSRYVSSTSLGENRSKSPVSRRLVFDSAPVTGENVNQPVPFYPANSGRSPPRPPNGILKNSENRSRSKSKSQSPPGRRRQMNYEGALGGTKEQSSIYFSGNDGLDTSPDRRVGRRLRGGSERREGSSRSPLGRGRTVRRGGARAQYLDEASSRSLGAGRNGDAVASSVPHMRHNRGARLTKLRDEIRQRISQRAGRSGASRNDHALFLMADRERKGYLRYGDILNLIFWTGMTWVTMEDLLELLRDYDLSGSGRFEYEDFVAFLTPMEDVEEIPFVDYNKMGRNQQQPPRHSPSPPRASSVAAITLAIADTLDDTAATQEIAGVFKKKGWNLRESFDRLNQGTDKKLWVVDFHEGLLNLGVSISEWKASTLFSFHDTDRDHKLHYHEFVRMFSSAMPEGREDVDQMLHMEGETVQNMAHSVIRQLQYSVPRYNSARGTFDQLDQTGKKSISKHEFLHGCQRLMDVKFSSRQVDEVYRTFTSKDPEELTYSDFVRMLGSADTPVVQRAAPVLA